MRVKVEVEEVEIRAMIVASLRRKFGDTVIADPNQIQIEFRARSTGWTEWDSGADLRVTYEADL